MKTQAQRLTSFVRHNDKLIVRMLSKNLYATYGVGVVELELAAKQAKGAEQKFLRQQVADLHKILDNYKLFSVNFPAWERMVKANRLTEEEFMVQKKACSGFLRELKHARLTPEQALASKAIEAAKSGCRKNVSLEEGQRYDGLLKCLKDQLCQPTMSVVELAYKARDLKSLSQVVIAPAKAVKPQAKAAA